MIKTLISDSREFWCEHTCRAAVSCYVVADARGRYVLLPMEMPNHEEVFCLADVGFNRSAGVVTLDHELNLVTVAASEDFRSIVSHASLYLLLLLTHERDAVQALERMYSLPDTRETN
jgi:hypothetical protein